MVTKAEIKASISDGNLNPKMFKRFFDDLKIKAYSYDYIIQRDLVNYYETRLPLNPLTSKIMDDVFSPDSDRVIEISISHQFVVPGEKERYKRSSVFNKFMTHEELTENMKYFKYNILVFIDDEIFTGYKAKAYRERLNLYFLTKDLHDIRKRIDPDTKVDEIAKNVTVLFLPNAVIGNIDNLEPRMFNGNNIEAYNFPDYVKDKFSKAGKYFGFWINKTNGSQYMIPYIEYNPEYKYFTLPDNPPTNISNYSLMVVGMSVIKDYKDIPGETEWIQFASERMPLPKDNIMILRERNGSYVPVNGNVSLTEYYPNIYRINNPNQWNLRIYALYEDSSQNNHIDYDEEITPYLQRIDILDQYNTDKVPEILKEYKPVQWNYSIQDFIEKNPYKNLDLSNQWDSFLYKMETISSMLKKWYLFYEEYERRTYGFLTGWYHNIANYKNMPDKIRLNTAQDIDNRDLYYEFNEPQYLFTYVNSTEFGNANSYCFFVDGVYTIPTKIIVYRGYQYVYFPTRIIKDTTVIEVERFDGVVINRDILIPEEGVTLKFSDLANVPTIANCLFFVNPEDGSYLNHNELETTIIDPEIGEVVVDFRTSVYKITPSMSIKIKANDENLINKYVRLCCNNQTFQFIERESGIDFTRGRDDEINLNRMNYVTNINESILPRLRIFTEQGRMIPKRDYYVNKHNSYDDPPRFNIPMKASDDERFCVAYIGYDERLIYHKDNIPSNGLISLEGRMQRPFSFAYHDIYLDGFRLTKYDVDIISPNTIIIKAIKKYNTTAMIEIYEKCHVDDKFVKFEYNEESEYIMDKLVRKETDFYKVLSGELEDYEPSGITRPIDDYRDHWHDAFKYYIPYYFINGDERRDLEAFFHIFCPGIGRGLLNADDRVKYGNQVKLLYYLSHDLTISEGVNVTPPERELDISSVIPNMDIIVDEKEYKEHGFIDNNFNPVYDDPYILKPDLSEPTKGYSDSMPYSRKYTPRRAFPIIDNTDRYVYVSTGDDDVKPIFPEINDTNYKMSDLYPGFYMHMFTVPDDISDIQITKTAYMYAGCTNLVFAPSIDMQFVNRAEHMFDGCKNMTFLPKGFDVSNVSDFSGMFQECEALNQVNIPELDTSNGEIFDDMFHGCISLTDVPDIDISNMKSMQRMFMGCAGLVGEFPIEIDCTGFTNFDPILQFVEGTNITSVKLKNVDTELQKSIDRRFFGSQVEAVYIDGKRAPIISDSIYRMRDLYPDDYQTMTQLPGPIVIESELHTIDEMFKDCFKLEDIEEFDISHVESMKAAMENCMSLPRVFPWVIDLSKFDNIEPLRHLFRNSSVKELTFASVSNKVRECLGVAISDKIEFIHFTDNDLLYFYPNKNKENELFPNHLIEIKKLDNNS